MEPQSEANIELTSSHADLTLPHTELTLPHTELTLPHTELTLPHTELTLASIDEALEELRQGKPIVVMDDEDRENEGDLIMAAEKATAEMIAFFVRHTTGILCAPMSAKRASELQLPPMVFQNQDAKQTAFTVSVDVIGSGTGVSGADRAMTLKALADPNTNATQFTRPGHIFPLVARPNGVLERRGHTEASYDLCRLAGLQPVGVIGEIVNDDLEGTMKRLPGCCVFAKEHHLKIVTIEQLAQYRQSHPLESVHLVTDGVTLTAQCELPVNINDKDLGQWTLKCWYSHYDGRHHVSIEKGDITREPYNPVIVRVHSECFTGDILGSQRCDCGEQLHDAMHLIASLGRGVILYNVGHEGRGIGLSNKIKAYQLQQTKGMDTYESNHALGFDDDHRKYDTAKAILKALKIEKINLLTCNRTKADALGDIVVQTTRLSGTPNPHNMSYLDAKHKKHGIPEGDIKKTIPTNVPIPRQGLKIGVVSTHWNNKLVDPLVNAVKTALSQMGVYDVIDEKVSGSFELPMAAKFISHHVDAVIAIGVLIKGDTLHFEMISNAVTHGLMNVQLDTGVPVLNGVLNCLTEGQAEVRCQDDSLLAPSWARAAVIMGNLNIRHRLDSKVQYPPHYREGF